MTCGFLVKCHLTWPIGIDKCCLCHMWDGEGGDTHSFTRPIFLPLVQKQRGRQAGRGGEPTPAGNHLWLQVTAKVSVGKTNSEHTTTTTRPVTEHNLYFFREGRCLNTSPTILSSEAWILSLEVLGAEISGGRDSLISCSSSEIRLRYLWSN